MNIDFGDNIRYSVTEIIIATFQRESGSPLILKNVMFVPGLKKILSLLQFWKTVATM